MGDPAALDRVGERLHHRVLADQLGEGLRAIFARQHAIGAASTDGRRKLRKIETQPRFFGGIEVVGESAIRHYLGVALALVEA